MREGIGENERSGATGLDWLGGGWREGWGGGGR